MNIIYSTEYGSKLYGTNTPSSDKDLKHLYLPDYDSMIIGIPLENKVKKTNDKKNVKNSSEDVDEEFIPIQVFAKHFYQGQTYALELAFSINGTHASQKINKGYESLFVNFVNELKQKFLTSEIKAMMGYAVNQANLYSFKGERLNVSLELLDMIKKYDYKENEKLSSFYDNNKELIEALELKYPKYFKVDTYDIGSGKQAECFKLLEKTLPFSTKVEYAIKAIQKIVSSYGSRAEASATNNVDWKATMHAVRIVEEGINLLKNKELKFPFDQEFVSYLLDIKSGLINIEDIRSDLSKNIDSLKTLELTTDLKPSSQTRTQEFNKWLASWMKLFYEVSESSLVKSNSSDEITLEDCELINDYFKKRCDGNYFTEFLEKSLQIKDLEGCVAIINGSTEWLQVEGIISESFVRNGRGVVYYDDGSKMIECHFENDKLHGEYKHWGLSR